MRLLPALPEKWSRGSIKGLCTRAGVTANISWDEKKISAVLVATANTTFKIRVKEGSYEQITLKKGEKYVI